MSKDLTDEEVEHLEKLIVKLHYDKRVDIYSLCSKHNPEAYARTQRKQKIPEQTRWKIYRRDNYTCLYCFTKEASLTLDHVSPESNGGDFSEENLVTACGKCNNKKADRTAPEFLGDPWIIKKRNQNSQHLSTMEKTQARQTLRDILVRTSKTTGVKS